MITLDSPVEAVLGGAAKKVGKVKEQLGIRTVGDLLRHFPRTYLKVDEPSTVTDLAPGQHISIVGRVGEARLRSYQDRRTQRTAYRLEVRLDTDGPSLRLTYFARNKGIATHFENRHAVGTLGVFIGKVDRFRDEWQLTNPTMVPLEGPAPSSPGDDAARAAVAGMRALFPVYPATAGVESWDLQAAVAFALSVLAEPDDPLPEWLREERNLVGVREAFERVHQPDSWADVTRGLQRFRFDEALVTQLVLARRRAALRAVAAAPRTGERPDGTRGGLLAAFDARLPFELTAGQVAVGAEIEADLAADHPMNRLLQGEVGSGKTLVALRAMLRVVDSGGQAVLLAPTEVLAQQHHRSLGRLLGDLAQPGMLGGADEATGLALLTGSSTTQQRREALLRIASGEAGIVVGTHALLEDRVSFADLGLVVVDEQHRFGVEQRAALTDKAEKPPHVLVMTATPIPRTVAMTVFGDLETSVLSELPAGRAPIQTNVVPLAEAPRWLDRAWQRVREEVEKGHQAYVVCPRISEETAEQGESDAVDLDAEGEVVAPPTTRPAAVESVVALLREGPLAGLRVEALHGRMAPDDKDRVMRRFAAGEVDVLVSTTVIEVGVDVANATTMVLLDADRFGVSQLHQLRGRVGRGGLPGLCLLVTNAAAGTPARERLDAVAATTDGFELSRVDLEQRREGDVLGASQSGRRSSLQTLRVLRDEGTIVAAREVATALLADDPDLRGLPQLGAAVVELETSAGAAYLERS
ncbi:ATP-dependent DNA helicase RecG [Nocardioides sp. ChNu-153]|uniref:ATP-dependent DNA helicase RecG n=1 Tax=unclassified Nocardioides TaxID=2615069 RepID=UPI002404F49A|nr:MULTISPECIES: ATP-dependent DNA helicase RecG [unclassified Nocardioides]MDF9716940.1 ATP-dependent DNA helicase RecG [Nocardioides sp. ChNu-99]MDN7122645.1 ATP-dependent DNA helicase RecG [Nocardioides sp. ChNu-153]